MGAKLLLIGALAICFPVLTAAQPAANDTYLTGTVVEVLGEERRDDLGIARTIQRVRLEVSDGTTQLLENAVVDGEPGQRLVAAGETVTIERLVREDGSTMYLIRDAYRLPALLWLCIGFLALTVIFGKLTGITSTLGLALSIAVLAGGVTPLIAAGHDPLLVSLGGAVIIACTSLLLAHGFRRRTYIALLSTLLTLGASTLLALLAVWLSALSGLGSEETVFLQTGTLAGVDLRGLLLGGIIIGCLGVLDDITTAQTAAVDEISRANPSLGERELMRAGMSVGREHIASLTNTIALAYAGASFPLLLLLSAESRYPLWSTLNSEFFAEEIVRTLVGSATLVLAVPLSTWLAVRFLRGRPHDHRDLHHHSHSHAHGHL